MSDKKALDIESVRRVAKLARIGIDEAQCASLADELSAIVGFVAQLEEVDTEGVAPLASAVDVTMPMRDDKVTDGDSADDILANAPVRDEDYFVVPKVIE